MAQERSVETTIWSGTPSQVINLGTYLLCILFCWLVVPIFIMLWKWLVVRATQYEVTTQRLRLHTGVLNRKTDEMELYRVRDYRIEQPLFLRLFSLANIILVTADKSDPFVVLRAVPNGQELLNGIRDSVETLRRSRGVREVDLD